jgi:hypothetical protein
LDLKKRAKEGACVYCGAIGALTDDHVPPKNLFPKPRMGLITVPACEPCNGNSKLDDEYFRLAITSVVDAKKFPIAIEAIHKLGMPQKIRFAKTMLSNIDRVNGDLYLDRPRLQRVIERVIRGLFSHHQRRTLPTQSEIRIWFTSSNEAPMNDMEFEIPLNVLRQQHLTQIGKGIFSYRYVFDSNHAGFSAWYFRFYEKNEVFAITINTSVGCVGQTPKEKTNASARG